MNMSDGSTEDVTHAVCETCICETIMYMIVRGKRCAFVVYFDLTSKERER